MYNQTKSKMMMNGQDPDENNMGAYGIAQEKKSYEEYQTKYDDNYSPKHAPSKTMYNKNDPFNWENPKPSSQKFENNSKPKQAEVEFEDTGNDGWNDVKRSGNGNNRIPDPYAKSSNKKGDDFDSYFEGDKKPTKAKQFDFDSHNNRGKSGTVANKKSEFNEDSQPKSFDFDGFGKTVDKKDDVRDSKPKNNSNADDPFAWDDKKPAAKPKAEDFDFDFGSEKPKAQVQKQNVADLFESEPQQKTPDFDPFADNSGNNGTSASVDDLSDIKFDVPAPVHDPLAFESAETVVHDEKPAVENEPPRDVSDPWAKKELFNLKNIKKDVKKMVDLSSNDQSSGFGGSKFGQPLPNSNFGGGYNAPTGPQTAEQRMSAMENAFGSSATDNVQPSPQPIPQSQPMPQNNNFGEPQPAKTKNNDFGEFPSMFGASNDGFGNFEGFGNAGFSGGFEDGFDNKASSQPAQQTQQTQPQAAPKPTENKKKDDWFEF
jgi:hypothetical protein